MALLAVGLSVCGALTVADEVQNNLHLLGEAQWFDFNDLGLAVRRTLLGFNGNLERHLEARGEFIGSLKLLKEDALKLIVPFFRHDCVSHLLFVLKRLFLNACVSPPPLSLSLEQPNEDANLTRRP